MAAVKSKAKAKKKAATKKKSASRKNFVHEFSVLCQEAGISLGSVAPVPIRCQEAEKILEGREITLALAQEAAGACAAVANPIDDIRASAEYRKLMCEVLPRRLICQAAGIPLDPS